MNLIIRSFRDSDLDTVLDIAVAAWQPIFASSKEIVGNELFELTHPDPDASKRAQVAGACRDDDPRQVWVAESDCDKELATKGEGPPGAKIIGFIIVHMYLEREVAEIGNNAVSPAFQGRGIGAQMYAFVLERMREAGMKAAIVTTGGDDAHAPARRAYEKAGFSGPVPSMECHIEL